MSSTRKTSDEFASATGDYATYTNEVDKPHAQPKAKPVEAPERAKVQNPPEPSEFYDEPKGGERAAEPKGGERSAEPKPDTPKAAASKPATK